MVEKYYGKTQWRTVYEVIVYLCITTGDYFNNECFLKCKLNEKNPQIIPSENKKKTKAISIESELYSQVAMTRNSIVKDNGRENPSWKTNAISIQMTLQI